MINKIFLTFLIFISLSYSSEQDIKKLYYDDINPSNLKESQDKINSTYLFGIDIVKESLKNMKKSSNLDTKLLIEECNESLYLAIFENTIVDKLGRSASFKKFENDCKTLAKQLSNSK